MHSSDHGNSVSLDDVLGQRVEECARENGVSPAQVVRSAVEEYLTAHGPNGASTTAPRARRLAEIADDVARSAGDATWGELPRDLSKNFEHYRYGYPRED